MKSLLLIYHCYQMPHHCGTINVNNIYNKETLLVAVLYLVLSFSLLGAAL